MTFNLWASQLLISIFFIAGFITYYEWHVRWALGTRGDLTTRQRLARLSLPAVIVLLSIWLQYTTYTREISVPLYLNLQLFVLAYPLLNDRLTSWEFWIQGLIGGLFWFINHTFIPELFLSVAIILIIQGLMLRYFRPIIRYNWWAHLIYAAVLSVTYWVTYLGINNGQRVGYIVIFMIMSVYSCTYSNATHRRSEERATLTREVNYDTLTNAKSYTKFLEEATQLFEQMKRDNHPMTFVELDLDNFKAINDKYSHLAGNGVLVTATRTLKATLDDYEGSWELYRTGGEEFVILLPNASLEQSIPIIRQCWAAIDRIDYHHNREAIQITASFGVTTVQAQDVVLDDVYGRADDSLYVSKQHGRNCITIDGKTLDANPFATVVVTHTFFTQPIIKLPTQQIVCEELLMRIFDQGKWRLPVQFDLGITTQVSLMERLLGELQVKSLSINLTVNQFTNEHNCQQLVLFVKQTPQLHCLTVEISALPSMTQLQAFGRRYRNAGIRIMIDDELKLPGPNASADFVPYVDGVKLNLHQILGDTSFIIQEWQTLMNINKKQLILEGIESREDFELAQKLGIMFGQGYYFSRPVMPRMI